VRRDRNIQQSLKLHFAFKYVLCTFSALPSVSLCLYHIKMRCSISQTENGEEKKSFITLTPAVRFQLKRLNDFNDHRFQVFLSNAFFPNAALPKFWTSSYREFLDYIYTNFYLSWFILSLDTFFHCNEMV
jgi:hypothetical protein